MLTPTVIIVTAFIGVAALVGGLAILLRSTSDERVESRLNQLTGKGGSISGDMVKPGIAEALDAAPGFFEDLFSRISRLRLLFEQADTTLTPTNFVLISAATGLGGAAAAGFAGFHVGILPVMGIIGGSLPLVWLLFRRRKRFRQFAAQLPDALELIARALRAGHSLASGFQLVSEEMIAPLGKEFGRVFDEQNLGIPLDEALESLTDRVPNLDLKFFATAVVLQRQTGGDLAEILDKIGHLIRERFKIWGQVQALTGEGRLSGVVLLALPPVLFVTVYRLNPDYVMVLFSDPWGKKMLLGAIVMQLLGALVIRKIVNIRV